MSESNKSLSKGGAYYLVYNVLNMAFPFLTGIYVARILLPETIGEVAAAQNLATYFVIFAFLGIPTYGLREIAKVRNNREERNKVFSELYVINLISTLVFALVYLVLISVVPRYKENYVLHLITGISIALNAFNISWLYEGMEDFRFISVRNILFKAVSFLLLVLLVRSPEDYLIYAGITVIGTAGNYVVNMIYLPRYANLSFKNLNLKRHMKSILYLVAVNLAIEIYSLMDVTMMNFLSSKESIAFYKYGNAIQKMLLQVINTFTMVLVPRITFFYKEKDMTGFNRLVSKGMELIVLFSIPMIVGIYFTSDFLIRAMYGEQFVHSATILKMFSVLLLVSPTGYLLGSRMLLVTDHENRMIICVGTGALVNLIGNALLIPVYHEFGAAIASIASEFVVMIIYVSFGRKYFTLVDVHQTILKVICAAIAMALYLWVCSLLKINAWIVLVSQIVGASIIYILLLIMMKEENAIHYYSIGIRRIKSILRRS